MAMPLQCVLLAACLLAASTAAAQTVYKYRHADGRVMYSNRQVPGLELIETFEYRFAEPAPASPARSKGEAEGEARIRTYLDVLQVAWTEVQEATSALAAAEERLRTGVEPQEGETLIFVRPVKPAPPAAGGPAKPAPPAVGGPMGRGHGGGMSPEYVARMEALESDVKTARERLDAALRRYHQLR